MIPATLTSSMRHERKASALLRSLRRQIRVKMRSAGYPCPNLIGWTLPELLDFDRMVRP